MEETQSNLSLCTLELTRVNPFFSNEKPGRRSTSGDFGKFISKSLARANLSSLVRPGADQAPTTAEIDL